MTEPSMEELTRFGIGPQDEGRHPFSPDHDFWNESWFLDFFDGDGERAGHLRIGLHPNQGRAFVWVLLYEHGEWLVVEEARLPLGAVDADALAYDGWGLRFRWDRTDPLRAGRLAASGFGRVVTGARAGQVLPFAVDLAYRTVGAAHSTGPADVPGHTAEGYSACRFEQAVVLDGAMGIGSARPFAGRGERDHSWGPRDWNIEWCFCVLGGDDFRLQWAAVDIPGLDRIGVGYHQRDGATHDVVAVEHTLDFDDGDLARAVSGSFRVTDADGSVIAGTVETVSSVEIDITHCFDPPRPTVYRRSLVRITPVGGGAAVLGWLESNRFARE